MKQSIIFVQKFNLKPRLYHLEFLDCVSLEWQQRRDHEVEKNSQSPDVHHLPIVIFILEQLRGSIRWRTTVGVQEGPWLYLCAESQIPYLDLTSAEQNILCL